MGSNVLVVGGIGYLGGLTVDLLKRSGHKVTVYDNMTYEDRFLKNVDFIYGDICDTNKVVEIANNFDMVVWMAAWVGDPACQVDPEYAEKVNYQAVKDFCKHVNDDVKLIFMSTCSVYGMNEDMLDESSETNPLSVYADTKLRAEKHILDKNGCIFRLGTVYGLGDEHSRLRLDLVVNVMTLSAYHNKSITVNGGDQLRPIIAAKDVAKYIKAAVEDFHSGIYVVSYKNVKIQDLATSIAKVLSGIEIITKDMSMEDLRNYQVDPAKSRKTWDIGDFTTVESEIVKMYNIFKSGRIKDTSENRYHNGRFLSR
jgi:nucleoside-diphosphate-sugar epimerase